MATAKKTATRSTATAKKTVAGAVKKTTAKKTATKQAAAKKAPAKNAALKDPKGGLTAAGRAAFKMSEGAELKPGVKGEADTPEKMKRKGSFLRRHFANLRGPLVDADGKPTRLALQAHAWGEPVPKTEAAARKLADKGTKLLERYQASKGLKPSSTGKAAARKTAAKKKTS